MNDVDLFEASYFQWCDLMDNKIDIVVYFSKMICHFSL